MIIWSANKAFAISIAGDGLLSMNDASHVRLGLGVLLGILATLLIWMVLVFADAGISAVLVGEVVLWAFVVAGGAIMVRGGCDAAEHGAPEEA